jgi:hypothetical protein
VPVATHRMSKQRRARKAVLTVALAAGISSALVLGQATNSNLLVQLTNTVIGAGGQGDPTSVRVPDKLSKTVVPSGYEYYAVQYPATINLQASRDVGYPLMLGAITDRPTEEHLIVAGYSAGTLISEKVRRNLQTLDPEDAPSADQLTFVQIASPFAGNGGIYARFPGIAIPAITDAMGVGQATRYDTEYDWRMYDTYADFPAYFNPLSLANSLLAVRYGHPDAYYDSILPGTSPAYVTTVENTAGGTDTYVLYYSEHLPLLGPVRELAGLLFLTPLTEPVLSAVEPLLRLFIDMSYTDRVNANPATPTPFSFITPPAKIIEALFGVPGALSQGATNLLTAGQTPATLPDPLGNLVPSVAPLAPAIQNSQARLAIVPEPEPPATFDETPMASSESTAPTAAVSTSTASTSTASTSTANTPGDGLHPTVTSDGNKVTPGGAADTAPTGSGTTTPTTGTTTTTTTTSTGSTTGSTAGGASDGTASEGAAAA